MASALKSSAVNMANKGSKSAFYNEKSNPVFQAFDQELEMFMRKVTKCKLDKKCKPESQSRK